MGRRKARRKANLNGIKNKENEHSSSYTSSILQRILRKVEPHFVNETSLVINTFITIGAIFLLQAFFGLLIIGYRAFLGEVPDFVKLVLFISDISSTWHFIVKAFR